MSESLTRRDFLAYGGAAIAGVTLGETGRRLLARADERASAWQARGVETWATTVCRECPAGCGVRVRLMDGVPVKLEGNPLCPLGRGRLCAKGQAAIESYFDPDRLVGPARRSASSADAAWQAISWTDAIKLAAERLGQARARRTAILAVAADEHGPLADAWIRFWQAAGADLAWTPAPVASRLRPRIHALTGADGDPIFDFERATYVLSFGAPIVEDWLSGLWTQRSFGRFRRGSAHGRGRLVQIEGRRSATARKADEWLAVPADQQAVLAYGIAAVLLGENRIDRMRLESTAGNFAVFERRVTADYTPDSVASATGVPVVTILRLARELVSSREPLVVVDAGASPALVDAVFSLNAVVGAFDRSGGVFVKVDDPAPERASASVALREIAAGRARPSVLALGDSTALRSLDGPADLAALAPNTGFIISFSPYLDESAAIADLLLPVDTPLESWQAMVPPTALPADLAALARPAVERRLDTRDRAALLRSIATTIGGGVDEDCTWQSSKDLIDAEIKRLWSARRGTPYTTSYETDWVRQLESGGWWASPAGSATEFADRVLDSGGWIDPWFEPNQLSDAVRARGGLSFPLPDALSPAAEILEATPSVEEAAPSLASDAASREATRFPLKLVGFTASTVNLAGNINEPALFELLGQPYSEPWRAWVEISPETGARAGIRHGARVRITSAHNTVDAVAVHVPGMPSDAAALALVPGGETRGRWARLAGRDPRRVWGDDVPSHPCAVQIAPI